MCFTYTRPIFSVLCGLMLMLTLATNPVQARSLGGIVESIGQGASDIVGSIDPNKLNAKPQRDLMTLAFGGLVGFAVGGMFNNLGIVNVQVLGVAVIPIVSGLAGFYMANEGYFDGAKEMMGVDAANPPAP